jgi:hypothetical protein
MTRRRWIALGIGGGSLLAFGGVLRWLTSGYELPAGTRALVLSDKERVVVRAIVEALLPGVDGFPSGLELGVDQRFDEELWAQPDHTRADLLDAIEVLEHAPPLFGAMGRLSSLAPAARVEVLEAMKCGSTDVIVQAAGAIEQMLHAFYYGDARVWPVIGYDGPWIAVARPPQSATRYAELLQAARRRSS